MWDQHWCKGASARVAEMAPTMNRVVSEARRRGVLVVHAPSETMDFYKDTPQRKRAQLAPPVKPPASIGSKKLNPETEAALPIDDSDGGCDDQPQCPSKPPYPWKREIAALEIAPEDAISDKGQEVYNLLQQRGIDNVLIMGVHANMCVLGRSFSIRQMVSLGKHVLLMRDLTDSMYCSRRAPFVSHFRGTDLVVEHIEKYWCPSVTSSALTGQPPFRFKGDSADKF
jgi:nicotinamidase-related amidase